MDLQNPKLDRSWRPVLLALIVVVIFSRAPNLILEPRFWSYEATTYFSYARLHGLLDSLFFVSTSVPSYLNLSANIPAIIAARGVPLELAPMVTTVWSLLIQMMPFVLVLYGRSLVWSTFRERLIVALILLFGPPVLNAEVWLNSGNSQVFCGLIGVVLLCERTDRLAPSRARLSIGLLCFCALAGPYTAFLAPAFALKARIERTSAATRQAWVVAAAVVLQAAAHLWTRAYFPYAPSRLADAPWSSRATSLFVNDVLYTFFGFDLAPNITRFLGLAQILDNGPHVPAFAWLAGAGCFAGLVALLAWLLWRRGRAVDRLLPLSFALVVTALFVLVPEAGSRYRVVPGTILLLSVFSLGRDAEAGGYRRAAASSLVAVALVAGVAAFWRDLPAEYSPLGRAGGRPAWTEEVSRWRDDTSYRLQIWPYVSDEKWFLPLLPKDGPAPPTEFFEILPFSLIAKGGRVERIVEVNGLPVDFRLKVKIRSTQPSDVTRLSIVFENAEAKVVTKQRIDGFRWHEDIWVNRWSYLISLREGSDFSDVRRLRIVLRSDAEMPHRVKFDRFSIGPADVGAFEKWIPGRRIRRGFYRFGQSQKASVVPQETVAEDR